jgi:hypothetical protein
MKTKAKTRQRKPGPGPKNRLREYRLAAGLATQADAAKRAGVSPSLWQVWEYSTTLDSRSVATVRLCAWVVGRPIADLVDPPVDKPRPRKKSAK